jgi:hypothetical protein
MVEITGDQGVVLPTTVRCGLLVFALFVGIFVGLASLFQKETNNEAQRHHCSECEARPEAAKAF